MNTIDQILLKPGNAEKLASELLKLFDEIDLDEDEIISAADVSMTLADYLPVHLRRRALNPEWESAGRVHDWRNYVTPRVRRLWHSFTVEQKLALVEMANERANRENWD